MILNIYDIGISKTFKNSYDIVIKLFSDIVYIRNFKTYLRYWYIKKFF